MALKNYGIKPPVHRPWREHISIGAPAYLDTDADLVAWWQALPHGEGARQLKLSIRAHLDETTTLTTLHQELSALRQEMRGLREMIGRGVTVTSTVENVPDDEDSQRAQNMRRNTW